MKAGKKHKKNKKKQRKKSEEKLFHNFWGVLDDIAFKFNLASKFQYFCFISSYF